MGVRSQIVAGLEGGGFRNDRIAVASLTAASGAGTSVAFASDFTASSGGVDLSGGGLNFLFVQNTHATLTVEVRLDGLSNGFLLGPRESRRLVGYSTGVAMALVESTSAATVYLEAAYQEIT